MLSPVWRAKLCRGDLFEAGSSRTLLLGNNERNTFHLAVALGCGEEVSVEGGLAGLMALGQLADTYGMEGVCAAVEDAAIERLSVDACADLLSLAQATGLRRVEAACRALATRRFEAVSATAGFGNLDSATLAELLEDDGLMADGEERVLEAVVEWIRCRSLQELAGLGEMASYADGVAWADSAGDGARRGCAELLRKVRFRDMRPEYLAALCSALGALSSARIEGLHCDDCVAAENSGHHHGAQAVVRGLAPCGLDALQALQELVAGAKTRAHAAVGDAGILGPNSADRVSRTDVGTEAFGVALWAGRVWCGGWDGGIRAWCPGGAGVAKAVAAAAGHTRVVCALAGWGGYVLSGSADSRIGVWDAATGRGLGFLQGGHSGGVNALAGRARAW